MTIETIGEIIEQPPCALTNRMLFSDALIILANHQVNYAPVLNDLNEFVGIFQLNSQFLTNTNPNESIESFVCTTTPSFSSETLITEVDIKHFIMPILPITDENKLIGIVHMRKIIEMKEKITNDKIQNLKYNYEMINRDYHELQEILDHSYDGIAIANRNGFTEKVNKAWDRITGFKREDIIDKPLTELVEKKYFSDSVSIKVFDSKKTVTIMQEMKSGKRALVTGKPIFDNEGELSKVIMNVRDITELYELKENLVQKEKLAEAYHTEISQLRLKQTTEENIIAESKPMRDLIYLASQVARVDSRVLLTGESGVGKGVIARYIHRSSQRESKPFITVNCGAIPKDLLESELFGYIGGAFTGANPKGKMGLFELADGGTLFLDEITEMPLKSQVKLLTVLQEGKITRVGGTQSINLDVRIISATNRDLFQLVQTGKFREDLYYRLNVVPISIPALRERKEDIIPLAIYYLNLFNKKYHLNKSISKNLMEQISNYDWPGNIRELENFIERIIVTSNDDFVASEYFALNTIANVDLNVIKEKENETIFPTLKQAQDEMELKLITEALDNGGTQLEAARLLDISLSTLIRKMKKLHIY